MIATLLLTAALVQPPQAAPPTRFTLLHTNDEHASLLPAPLTAADRSRGGAARLATKVREWRAVKDAQGESTLLLSAGDFSTGSPFNWLVFEDESPELQTMVDVGYDVVILGNHEFDHGPDELADYLERVGYPALAERIPLLSANIRIPEGHRLGGMGIGSTHLVTLPNGLTLGFIGLMGKQAAEFVPQKAPVEYEAPAETAARLVPELRAAGADVVIAITHLGVAEDRELATAVPDLDVIVGGHSHTELPEPILIGKTVIVQTGELLNNLGVLELEYLADEGRVRVRNQENGTAFNHPLDASVPEDPALAARVARYEARLDSVVAAMTDGRVGSLRQVVTHAGFPLANQPEKAETPMGDFITDAVRQGVSRVSGRPVDVAFMANGVIRGAIPAGDLSFYDLASLVGLGSDADGKPGYPLVSVYFTGRELRRILEITVLLSELRGDTYYLQVSGVRFAYDKDNMLWLRVPFAGTPVPSAKAVHSAAFENGEALEWDDDRLYHVVSDYYNASFLPFIGTLVPSLELVIKDEQGNPTSIDTRVVRDAQGRPYRVWQAVVEHAMAEAAIPERYREPQGRISQENRLPIQLVPGIGVVAVVLVPIWWWRRRRIRAAS